MKTFKRNRNVAPCVVIVVVICSFTIAVVANEQVESLLQEFETNIRSVRSIIEKEAQRHYTSGEIINCGYNDIYDSAETPDRVFDLRFGMNVDLNRTVIRVPRETKQDDPFFVETCATKPAKQFWQQQLPANETRLLWQYFGGQNTGNIEFFPGFYDNRNRANVEYDSRFRPWYSVAATGPKNVVLVIDTSGSMVEADRIDKAKKSAVRILQTLTHTDYVSVVAFSDQVHTFPEDTLVQATEANRIVIENWVNALTAGGGTNFYIAMEAAFNLLDNSRRAFPAKLSGCHTAILFLTDGHDSSPEDVFKLLKTRNNLDIDARLFTFALGDDADESAPRKMACEHRGIFTRVADTDNLQDAMARYYIYFATGVDSNVPRWSELYEDDPTGDYVTSGAMPVYVRRRGYPRELFGVVSIDIKEHAIRLNDALTRDQVNELLLQRSKTCPDLSLTEDQLVKLRGDNQCDDGGLAGWAIALIVIASVIVVVASIAAFKK